MRIKTFIICLFILSGNLYADYLADNSHRIYKYLTIWQDKGYIKQLPPVRPYPLQLLKKLLAEVKEKGSPDDVEIADRYYKLITTPGADIFTLKGKNFPAPIYYSVIAGLITDTKDMYWYGGAKIDTSGVVFNDIISYTGKVSIAAQNSMGESFFPEYTKTLFVDDYNSGGAGAGKIDIGHLGEGGFFVGTDRFYFSAGFWRSSYGPFFDNGPVIGPQAPGAGHFALTYRGDWITVSTVFLNLIAKQYAQKLDPAGIPFQINSYTENIMKYLIVHTIEAHVADWLDLGLMQSVVGGGALHPEFLIPIQYVFYTQEQAGGYNNSQMGVYFKLRIPANIGIDFIAFIDDWNLFSKVNGSGLNFDSAQNKYAIQAGISWTPDFKIFKRLSFDYQIISQYMYTHTGQMPTGQPQLSIPYINYTHNGTNLGSAMEPNSDRFSLKAYVAPASWVDIDIFATFMRHGNASAGIYNPAGAGGSMIGDGTVWDDGWDNRGNVTFYSAARTLNQAVLEYTLQAGIEASFNFPFKYVEVSFKVGYIFQQIWNKSLTIASGTATATTMGPQSGLNQTSSFFYVSTEVKF